VVISIIIPTYNAAQTLIECVQACLNQDYPKDKLEIIIVDDGSTDDTQEIIKKYPVTYIYQSNSGPAKARNTGWRSARGEVICFTDSDCIPHKEWVKRLTNKFASEAIGAVAGSYEIASKKNLLAQCIHEEIIERHLRMPEQIHVFGSYNVAIKREVLERVGGFNEGYRYASGEDNDLSYRILKAGYKICFARDALVAHYHPEKLYEYLKGQYRHGFWRMKLYQAHPDMMKGDDYTNWKDIIEPPLALLLLFFLPLLWAFPLIRIPFLSLLVFYSVIQFLMSLKTIIRKRGCRFLYLSCITFLRGFARGLGMLTGGIEYFILRK